MAGQVVAVASGKGGVGKTTTAVNLGVVLRRADHSVALVDADLGMANLGPMLGVSTETTLHDVLSDAATLEEALVEEAPGFAVLAGSESLDDYPSADPQHLREVLESLAAEYDFVIVDTGAGMSHEDVLPLGLADRVVLVATPDPAAIGDTRKTAELAGLADGDIAGLVVTKADPETDVRNVATQVGVDLLGVIPYDPTVRRSTAEGRPLEAVDPETPAAVAYRDLADALADGIGDQLQQAPATDPMIADSPPAAVAKRAPEGSTPDAGPDDSAESAAGADDEEESERPSEGTTDDETDAESGAQEAPAESSESDDGGEGQATDTADPQVDAPEKDTAEATQERTDSQVEADPPEDEEEEDPLAEFEDDEPETSGGILARIGRLFR